MPNRLQRWSFFLCDAMVMFFFPHDAILIIFGDILPSQSVRLFFQIIVTDYFAKFFLFWGFSSFWGVLEIFGVFWWVFEGFWRFWGVFEGFLRCYEGYWGFSRWTSPSLRLFFQKIATNYFAMFLRQSTIQWLPIIGSDASPKRCIAEAYRMIWNHKLPTV